MLDGGLDLDNCPGYTHGVLKYVQVAYQWVVVGVVIASAYLSLHKSAEVMFNDVASR